MADQNKDENPNENLFKIIDGIILQINRTKKLFIIMIITVMVISPIALLISFLLFTPPIESTSDQKTRDENGLHRFFPIRFLPSGSVAASSKSPPCASIAGSAGPPPRGAGLRARSSCWAR